MIALRNEPRGDAKHAVATLRRIGIDTAMLTGDDRRTADAIGGVLGVTTLWMAILADTGATVLVTANARRLLGRKTPRA